MMLHVIPYCIQLYDMFSSKFCVSALLQGWYFFDAPSSERYCDRISDIEESVVAC